MRKNISYITDFLMLYGWAILVVVVTGLALYALGITDSCTYEDGGCVDYKYNCTAYGYQVYLMPDYSEECINHTSKLQLDGTFKCTIQKEICIEKIRVE